MTELHGAMVMHCNGGCKLVNVVEAAVGEPAVLGESVIEQTETVITYSFALLSLV